MHLLKKFVFLVVVFQLDMVQHLTQRRYLIRYLIIPMDPSKYFNASTVHVLLVVLSAVGIKRLI